MQKLIISFVIYLLALKYSHEQQTGCEEKIAALSSKVNHIENIFQNFANKFDSLSSKISQIEASLSSKQIKPTQILKNPNKLRL